MAEQESNQPRFFTGTAPGRLDVMGGFADYSGSLVLQMALREHTNVSLRLRTDSVCTLLSETTDGQMSTTVDFNQLLRDGQPDYGTALNYFSARKNQRWAAYVLGCVLVLMKEKGMPFSGADFRIHSAVPPAKGVSSSAALEVATMRALTQACGVILEGSETAQLAQKAENLVAGAPCGIMDQLSSCFGKQGHLLPITCQPDKMGDMIPVPEGLFFAGLDSGVRHAVSGSSYGAVRSAAFMGYTIIAQSLGVDRRTIEAFRESGDRSLLPYAGYLCNIPVGEFSDRFLGLLPEQLTGKEFQEAYGHTTDTVTSIDPEMMYQVRTCALHPVLEHQRVQRFLELVRMPDDGEGIRDRELGSLMAASHLAYTDCGIGARRTDEIVAMSRKGFDGLILGAKITGGGSGGTVCFLVRGEDGLGAVA
ncbi:MAG: galactokinase, partial [Bacteroidota bacterium]